MDTKLRNINYKGVILYILIAILISTAVLSALDVRGNLFLISKKAIYTNSELSDEINQFTDMAIHYAMYYKNESYTSNPDNITQADIDICNNEIREKKENEINEIRNNKYQYDNSFSNLSYEEQEKIIEDESKAIEEKYTYTDEQLEEYIIKRKVASFKALDAKLRSYKNLKFYANDLSNDILIGYNKESDAEYGRFLKEVNVDNGNVSCVRIFIDGNNRTEDNAFDKVVNRYSLYDDYYGYHTSYFSFGEKYITDSYDSTNAGSIIELKVWIPEEIQQVDYIYDKLENVKKCQVRFLLS